MQVLSHWSWLHACPSEEANGQTASIYLRSRPSSAPVALCWWLRPGSCTGATQLGGMSFSEKFSHKAAPLRKQHMLQNPSEATNNKLAQSQQIGTPSILNCMRFHLPCGDAGNAAIGTCEARLCRIQHHGCSAQHGVQRATRGDLRERSPTQGPSAMKTGNQASKFRERNF